MVDDSRRTAEPVNGGGGAGSGRDARPDAARPTPASAYVDPSRRLRESVQRRDELLALAAEDLRGPAASLLRHLRRLRRAAATAPPASDADRRALDALERQVRRVAAVSDALLAMSAIEGGQLQLRLRSVELGGLLSQLVETRRHAAQARSIDLAADVPPYPLSLTVDAQRLAEAIGELLDSALAATSRGGQVRLALEAQPDGARIVVLDGRATAPHVRRRADRLGGLATRLAVCRGFAELHGGSLDMTSRGGAHAVVLTVRSPTPGDARDAVRGAPGPGKARLLLVDDDQDGREALAMVLADDYEVHLAGDGREALETALVARPDVVLMDLYMPRMDGLAALEAMRADPLTEDVPVILISARGDDLTRSRSLDLGAVDFLQKPFSTRELKARIDRTLRLTRRETQLQVLARTDPLTGLANLRAFRARLEEEVKRARRYRTPLACVMVDMDHLKPINDELGHGAGDLAIGAVAEVLRHELRETDFGARYGGDEFVMLLPHTSAAEARVFAERACARLRETSIDVGATRLPLSASFGIAALGDEPLDDPGEALVRHADAALYAAKHAGRGRVAAHPSAEPALPAP